MPKHKSDPSKSQLGSPETEGQGTTASEAGRKQSSASKKQKQ
jgi:hypothetical protein